MQRVRSVRLGGRVTMAALQTAKLLTIAGASARLTLILDQAGERCTAPMAALLAKMQEAAPLMLTATPVKMAGCRKET